MIVTRKMMILFLVFTTVNSFAWNCKEDLNYQHHLCVYDADHDDTKKATCKAGLEECLIINSDANPCEGSHQQLHPNPKSVYCNQFVHCVQPSPSLKIKDCPANLLFNPSIQVCDWGFNYVCPAIKDYYETYYSGNGYYGAACEYGYGNCGEIVIERSGTIFYADIKHRVYHDTRNYDVSYIQCDPINHVYGYWGCYDQHNPGSQYDNISVFITKIDVDTHEEELIYPDPEYTTFHGNHQEFYTLEHYNVQSDYIRFIEHPHSHRVVVKKGDHLKVYHGEYYRHYGYDNNVGDHHISIYLGYAKEGHYGY